MLQKNRNFRETESYFMEKISSGFPSDVLQLLSLYSDTQRFPKATDQSCSRAAPDTVGVLSRYQMFDLGGVDTRTRADSVGNITELNSLY